MLSAWPVFLPRPLHHDTSRPENHDQQRERLGALGYQFESQTDTEVIAHLIHYYLRQGGTLLLIFRKA